MDTKTVPLRTPRPARPTAARRIRPLRLTLVMAAVGLLLGGAMTAVTAAASAERSGAVVAEPITGDGAGSASARNGGMPTAEDGYIPDGDSVSSADGSAPAVTRLDPALRDALGDASAAAAEDGITLRIASGWRSRAYQAWLLREAVQKYGSEQEAGRWVGTPATSAHVKGEAVDIAPYAAADWLDRKGARFGLCRTYDNEAWHFELSPSAKDGGCPPRYRDPSEDPRMQG
ncbi:M15 family metallopeptidase [Microbacterium sp. 22242]|uniref:M15 family metallopeptidase n=1 Tax=Microbacterium sp. 22242 TaxID=3453896 RepID=UPI003F86AE15